MKLIRPAAVVLFTLFLSACGGGGGSGSAAPGKVTNGNGTGGAGNTGVIDSGKNVLFVGDEGHAAFAAFSTLTPAPGASITPRLLDTGDTAMWQGIAYDRQRDRLYANNNYKIAIFEHASALNGKITPTREISLLIPQMGAIRGMQLDTVNDKLYVGYSTGSGDAGPFNIAVFYYASELINSFSGLVAPNRKIIQGEASNFVVDTQRNILYTSHDYSTAHLITVYPNQDQIDDKHAAYEYRIIALPLGVSGIAIDQKHDRLYVGSKGNGVMVIEHASTHGGGNGKPAEAAPFSLISLPNSAQWKASLAYDASNDRLYAGFDNIVYTLDAASQITADTRAPAAQIVAPEGSRITTFAF